MKFVEIMIVVSDMLVASTTLVQNFCSLSYSLIVESTDIIPEIVWKVIVSFPSLLVCEVFCASKNNYIFFLEHKKSK